MRGEGQLKKHSSRLLLGYLLVAIISFGVGMKSDMIFSRVAPLLGFRVSSSEIDLSSIQETFRALEANYDGELDVNALIHGASRGLVAAAGDPHTAYLDPDEVKEFNQQMNGSIGGGIGAEIGVRNGRSTIIRPLKDSPAARAGVQAGDIILNVNDKDVTDWANDQIIQRIRGEVGTKVKIKLLREQKTVEVSIVREEISTPSVEAEIEGKVGILTVNRFSSDTGALARAEAKKFVDAKVTKVILDLRGNPGGEVTAAQALAGIWLDNQVVLTQRRSGEIVRTDKSAGSPILKGVKTIVLVDGDSASASEIIAGAFQDYKVATLVGETTFGKGSVQVLLSLSGGSQMKVTESRWFTPNGRNIDKTGITPDVQVGLTAEDFNNDYDPQMEKAMSL